jgi:hypothetical protein
LNPDLKEQFITGRRYGKIRGITMEVKKKSDLYMVRVLIDIKERLK